MNFIFILKLNFVNEKITPLIVDAKLMKKQTISHKNKHIPTFYRFYSNLNLKKKIVVKVKKKKTFV